MKSRGSSGAPFVGIAIKKKERHRFAVLREKNSAPLFISVLPGDAGGMLWWPLNDHECLARVTLYIAENVYRPNVITLAARFRTTGELIEWLRSLPQRNDS